MGWIPEFIQKCEEERKESRVARVCSLCQREVDMNDNDQKQCHENGRRHQTRLQMKEMGILH